MKKAFFAIIPLIVALIGCSGTPKATGTDELDLSIREASDYLNDNIPAGSKIVILNIQSDSLALSNYIIDELIANAVNDKNFEVVDRQQLDLIRAEQNFQFSGEVDDNQALEIGKFFGAQSIVSGTVSQLGDRYRMTVRALEVQSARVQGQFNRNMDAGKTITALLKSGSGSSGTATATGGRTSTGNTTASGTTQTVTPARPAGPAKPQDGTYTYWPRPQATQGGLKISWYLDKVFISGNYMTVYVSGTERGEYHYPGNNSSNWASNRAGDNCYLDSEDVPGRRWKPVRTGGQDSNYGGQYFTFENVVGKHFTMTGDYNSPPVVMDIILGEPDK